ncbi:unnamed protein product, partial [Schistosoma mattheei]
MHNHYSHIVIYFNGRGRAESIRMTLVAAGVNYEDERISFQDWPKIKPTIPGGRLPAVKITDNHGHVKWMVESLAIARYMAKKHHMMGGTEEEYYNVEKLIAVRLKATNLGSEGEVVLLTVQRCDSSKVFPSDNQHDGGTAFPQGGVWLEKVDPKNLKERYLKRT